MLYWESKRRLGELSKFRALVRAYFDDTAFDTRGRRRAMTDLRERRKTINASLPEAVRSCYRVGQSVSVQYIHPHYGAGSVNVIENIFSLDEKRIPVAMVFDYLDRTIGEYERVTAKLKKQSWNPFYWLRLGFLALIGFPFRILGAAGFDSRAIEQSLPGKVVKSVVGLVVFLSALLQAIYYLGLPTGWHNLVSLFHHK
jgi:hypothetical protein